MHLESVGIGGIDWEHRYPCGGQFLAHGCVPTAELAIRAASRAPADGRRGDALRIKNDMFLSGLGTKGLGERFQSPDEVPGQDPDLGGAPARTRPGHGGEWGILAGENLGSYGLALIEVPIQEVRYGQRFDRVTNRIVVTRRKLADFETSSSRK